MARVTIRTDSATHVFLGHFGVLGLNSGVLGQKTVGKSTGNSSNLPRPSLHSLREPSRLIVGSESIVLKGLE